MAKIQKKIPPLMVLTTLPRPRNRLDRGRRFSAPSAPVPET